MLEIVLYSILSLFLVFTYIYFKEKYRHKDKIPFHKDRLK